jgi:arylsulfatase A-like enzyme
MVRRLAWTCALASVVVTLACGGVLAPGEPPPGAAAKPRPNVLMIVLDTLRADHVSCLGKSRPTTPALDALAREGTLYATCISPGSWTLPSHASLFTGLYFRDHRAGCQTLRLDVELTTLAEALGGAGYATVGFSNNPWLGSGTGLTQGFAEFHDVWRDRGATVDQGAAVTNERALAWIDDRPAKSAPFFMFVNYLEPHLAYAPPPPFDRAYLPEEADPARVARLRAFRNPDDLAHDLKVPGHVLEDEDLKILAAQYAGEVAYLDSRLGELVQGLRSRGLLDGTLLVVTSDHGEHLGDHGLLDHKMSLYDALLHVPLVLRYPASIPSGLVVTGLVQTNDVYPTVLATCGIQAPPPPGSRLLPFDDERDSTRTLALAEFDRPAPFAQVVKQQFPDGDFAPFDRSLLALRTPRYKLIVGSDGRRELYDVSLDPGEKNDLCASEPRLLADLSTLLGSLPQSFGGEAMAAGSAGASGFGLVALP